MSKEVQRVMEIVDRVAEIKDKLEAIKPMYNELDDLIGELTELVQIGETLKTEDNRYVTLVDNFSEKNTVFKVAGVRRFDIELLTTEELVKKQNKLAKASEKIAK